MYRNWIRTTLAGVVSAVMLAATAAAGQVELNGVLLPEHEGWVDNGVSYVTLKALSRESGYALSWDGQTARLTGAGAELTTSPGELYVEVNGRALYLPGGVQTLNGRIALPLRVLENALGAEVTWDSVRATAALNTRSAQARQADYDQEDLHWLSRVISAESRGESLLGQIAVGNVVLNRVRSAAYPDTIRGVVFDRNNGVQFEPIQNGSIYDEPTQLSVLAAKLALEGADVVGECMYFFAPALSTGSWIVNNCTYYTTIGCHRFYF